MLINDFNQDKIDAIIQNGLEIKEKLRADRFVFCFHSLRKTAIRCCSKHPPAVDHMFVDFNH